MSFIKSMASTNQLITAEFYNKTITVTSGVPTETWSSVADLSVSALFWTGAAADRVVGEKLKAEVDGVIAMDYDDYTTTINEDAKVLINDVEYRVVRPDNIANQNVLIQIPVKRKI